MSKFIELTKRDSGKLLVLVDQIIWVADDVETADRILTLINKN